MEDEKKLYGKPTNQTHTANEIMSNIEEEDLDFELLHEGKSTYSVVSKLGTGFFEAKSTNASIHRSSLKDKGGSPMYICYFTYEGNLSLN